MSIEDIYRIYSQHSEICTDTRHIKKNCLFFCLKGEHFNGNTFASDALKKGAAYVIVDEEAYAINPQCILVNNVLQTLQDLAHYHRKQWHIPILGITGTNGKTSTKELIKTVLSKKYTVLATKGNLNNHIGVPLTLLSIHKEVEIAVVEMGANHAHEIKDLCQIALPNFGIITNIGKAHLEGFRNIETIIETKTALYRSVQESKGKIFIHIDDTLLMEHGKNIPQITYGSSPEADYYGKVITDDMKCKVFLPQTNTLLSTHLVGAYNFSNIMAAIAVGQYFKVPISDIQQAISSYIPTNSRSQILHKGSNTFILDAYNANPSSMIQAIKNFAHIKHDYKILLLGDMKELGADSIQEHQSMVDLIKTYNFSSVFLIGPEFAKTEHPKGWSIESMEKAAEIITAKKLYHAMILVKGSRTMQMERMLDYF